MIPAISMVGTQISFKNRAFLGLVFCLGVFTPHQDPKKPPRGLKMSPAGNVCIFIRVNSLELTIITSLKIIFVYGAMKPGMVFDFLPRVFDWVLHWLPVRVDLVLKKPFYDCLFCMASVWGLLFTYQFFEFSVNYAFLILQVGGVNYLVATVIAWYHDQAEKNETYHQEALFKEEQAKK